MTLFLAVIILLTFFSLTFIDLNLTFYPFLPNIIKSFSLFNRPLANLVFFLLSFTFIISYLSSINKPIPKKILNSKWIIFTCLLGILSYPMFSYDIFNYLFNAKMVLIYKVNPHLVTANQFSDPILRFMHNVHTPAPYAYGWTIISLIPGLTWLLDKFTLSFWAMKSFMAAFWLGNLWILKKLISKLFSKETYRWWLFALSPLVLIETLINGHNDVVMMLPAFISFWFLVKSKKLLDKNWVTSVLFLLLSASIKYATIVLLPFYFFAQLQGLALKLKKIDLPTLFSWVLLAVMFTRPGQMHSWYLIWAFSFSVLSKSKTTLSIFTALSIGALFRYLPYIYFGNWDSPVNLYRQLIWFSSLALTPIIYKKIQPK